MESYKNIEQKLHQFVRKFYTNELIKGTILFLSLGFLYLFLTLFIEYFLWLKPTARTILFWLFIVVESYLVFRFILTPIFKLIGLKKGISFKESSKVIGTHFTEVGDKLINVLQLKESLDQSDLLLASIEQKANELQPIPFAKAVNFKTNATYLKYAAIPVFIWLLITITGNFNMFNTSFKRVVNHRTAFAQPAPFSFHLVNENLKVIQGKSFIVEVETKGKVTPTDVTIFYNNQSYFLQNQNGTFSYTFTDTRNNINFYVEANGITSDNYQLNVVKTPTIQNISIDLTYPKYIRKKNETINSTGTILIPEGTKTTWNVATNQTDSVAFISDKNQQFFIQSKINLFTYSKRILKPFNYQIATSNSELKEFEKLFFKVDVVKDEFPEIEVLSDIDSPSNNTAQFAGKFSDDYGIRKLEVVFYDEDNPAEKTTQKIEFDKGQNLAFYFNFPGDLEINKGIDYEIYFQVFDNDGINGSKKSQSKKFSFRNKSDNEIEEESVLQQRKQIKSIENTLQKKKSEKKELEEIKQNLQNNKNVNWNDKKKIENYIQRQEQYKQMMQRQTDKLQENIKDLPKDSQTIKEKKEQLKKRIEELKKLEKEQKLLDELKKLAEKLNKDDLLRKVKQLAEQNKQQERSLERILELTKRFYVEQKAMQIANKLDELSKKQDSLAKRPKSTLNQQKEIKKAFKKIEKELRGLEKDNKALKEPMQILENKEEQKEINNQLNKSEQNQSDKKQQKKSQKKASQKMQEMSQKMQQAMDAMGGEMKEANQKSLRIILENLLNFSFKQENLMDKFSKLSVSHPDFGKELKSQNTLKTYFEHIDDSLYVLSMRLPEISPIVQKDLTNAHYNIDQSLENFAENRFNKGLSNQQYVMTSVNNLADFLSDILDNMQQAKNSKPGKGKKGGKSFSLPDIIKKQGDLVKKMQEGDKKGQQQNGKKQGESKGNRQNDDLDGDLYKTYQEQSQLRQELQNALKKNGKRNNPEASKVLKSMEELENEILEKGFNKSTIQKMQQLKYNLLKLDKAAFEQDKDTKRKSSSNQQKHNSNSAKLLIKKLFYNQTEILNRQSLPLQKNYKKKVQKYFSNLKKQNKSD
jgi:hypothetical protein